MERATVRQVRAWINYKFWMADDDPPAAPPAAPSDNVDDESSDDEDPEDEVSWAGTNSTWLDQVFKTKKIRKSKMVGTGKRRHKKYYYDFEVDQKARNEAKRIANIVVKKKTLENKKNNKNFGYKATLT